MKLIIGGVGSGKLEYAAKLAGVRPEEAAMDLESAKGAKILSGLHRCVREAMEAGEDPDLLVDELLAANPEILVISDEIGCGIVPLDPFERRWREKVGRVCCRLAGRADEVIRMDCGCPQKIKG
ncbi:MAG TPA: bifunctional adenosylcobinamide kinase/adenosylcobinamide-phosphate guanylyltransferase [Oscillospiraceae bacterium]|nr:bifunctional adenosylcobinamide kinase/adenosylcobinamide-phosphate guanylyltransferase [Oscillospiraceae bacterium]HNW04526.1 bifunctional adenosylcobinamide kinase/adenosylcobinamide-phosphate guanylyltransferase [Oscillospiraceae bacterium]HPW00369.1 bifunctional adenosylcobinamide kinase/adenosylcobinamide-phosphate guanylyltransferase [Oscillospiraceae bacterium]